MLRRILCLKIRIIKDLFEPIREKLIEFEKQLKDRQSWFPWLDFAVVVGCTSIRLVYYNITVEDYV